MTCRHLNTSCLFSDTFVRFLPGTSRGGSRSQLRRCCSVPPRLSGCTYYTDCFFCTSVSGKRWPPFFLFACRGRACRVVCFPFPCALFKRSFIMGRKKRRGATLKPFCYYCDREFDDEKVLIQHQKAKHFKCTQCARKLDTATGLAVHLLQVHKEQINAVPNALSGRDMIEVIVHGMEGIPQEIIDERLSKQSKRDEGKATQKRQRVNWAQVTMAPTSMEQFALQAQQGILPTFAGLPSLLPPSALGTPGALPGVVSLPFPPPIAPPGLTASLPAPPCIQGLLGNTGAPAMSAVGVPSPLGGASGLFATPGSAATGPVGANAMDANKMNASGSGVPPSPPGRPPVNFAAPPLPANVMLLYNDDMISMEERRAHTEFGYRDGGA
ncbi:zinc c2h2 type domain-containing protein [Cystoisospora suis]|uniref:Zinc c2h2 type domain-containing protein n=1 Tax=Cystoisospora suis TaxID=483139 RepID=A0A2C6KS48_9APIC|nr:zinc c2h2 type domain-containing protein [Cystoisospora suis]